MAFKKVSGHTRDFCSLVCFGKHNTELNTKLINCKQCNKGVRKQNKDFRRLKNMFCSSSCAAIYNNNHKTKGCRRSKLEMWLEKELTTLYPSLEIHCNKTNAINAELDIYIPSLKLAFELNGIFHYEPIYGKEKLERIKNNDSRKFQACLENNIELCIIDVSKIKYFKKNHAEEFLNIISELINKKIGTA